jgi:pilus assembly protein Flp/PilA
VTWQGGQDGKPSFGLKSVFLKKIEKSTDVRPFGPAIAFDSIRSEQLKTIRLPSKWQAVWPWMTSSFSFQKAVKEFVMAKFLKSFLRRDEGASLVEYTLLLVLIAVVAITAVSTLGTTVSTQMNTIEDKID